MKKILFLLTLIASVMATSCTSSKKAATVDTSFAFDKLNGKWIFVETNGTKVSKKVEKQPFVIFDISAGRINGNAGCNIIGGEINRRARTINALAFDKVFSTKMMCDPESNKVESSVIEVLNNVQSYERLTNGQLIFIDKDDNRIAVLERELVN